MVLREYTDDMLRTVCADLRKWLQQLGALLSVYHTRLLDGLRQRSRLRDDLAKEREQNRILREERCIVCAPGGPVVVCLEGVEQRDVGDFHVRAERKEERLSRRSA